MTYYSREIARITKKHLPRRATIEPIIRARRMLDTRCCEGIDLDSMAREVYLSTYHFSRLFKRCYGCSPHQYLTEKRIEEAKRLLGKGIRVEEACFRTGFASVTSFAALFKRHTARSPSAWRKERGAS